METQEVKNQRRKAHLSADKLNELIIEAIQDKKGIDVIKIDLRHLSEAPTDFFIICHGNNENQVKAIADNIEFEVKMKGNELPLHTEGKQNSVWILVDYFDTVVHVFHHEAREYYGLEKLWSDGKVTEYQNL
ncbi:MAG: ribosome silencing factor [Saprospiraceae bacterium]